MFVEDLELFFEDFGIEVVFTRDGDEIATSTLIHDAPMSEISVYDRSFYDEKFYEARMQGSAVTLLGVAAQVAEVEPGDTVTVNAIEWYVITKEPDGTGMVTFKLSADSI